MSSLHVASLIIALLHARLRALRRRVGLSPKVVGIATRDPAFPRWRWWLLAPRLRVGLSPKVVGIATPDPVFCLQPPIPAQVFPCVGFCSGPFSWAFGFLSWAFASFRFRLALSACVFESPVFLPSFRRRCERGAWSVVACFEGKQSVVDLGGVYAQLLNLLLLEGFLLALGVFLQFLGVGGYVPRCVLAAVLPFPRLAVRGLFPGAGAFRRVPREDVCRRGGVAGAWRGRCFHSSVAPAGLLLQQSAELYVETSDLL